MSVMPRCTRCIACSPHTHKFSILQCSFMRIPTIPPSLAQESLDTIKLLGCAIGICCVFLYSVIDNI